MIRYIDHFIDVTKHAKKLTTSEYRETGKYPIIDQGQKEIAGYTDLEVGLFTDVPAIIFGDHTRVIKYVNTPFYIGADGVKVIRSLDKDADYKYIYYLLSFVRIPDTGYNRHYKWLKETTLPEHNKQQQAQIVKTLTIIDNLIMKHNTQTLKLDDLIKSRFVEMFGTESFETAKLKTVCTKITDGTHKTPNYLSDGIPFISAKNIINNEIDYSDVKYISKEEYEEIQRRCQTKIYDILLSKSGSLGSPAILRSNKKLGLFESIAIIKYDRNKLVPEYLREQIKSDTIQQQFRRGTKGVAIKHLHLNVIGNVEIVVPPLGLQKEFADFVTKVEKQKSIVQKSICRLETLKKSLMQKYFG